MWMIIISARLSGAFTQPKPHVGAPCDWTGHKHPASQSQHSAQSRYRHGIDFKNPFTMSKRVVSTQHHRDLRRGEPFLFIPGKSWGAHRTRAPSVAAKLRLMARFAALAALTAYAVRVGGAYRDRTDDLLNANQALSQLS